MSEADPTGNSIGAWQVEVADLRHPLAVLAGWLSWARIEVAHATHIARRARENRSTEGEDLFGPKLWLTLGACRQLGSCGFPCL